MIRFKIYSLLLFLLLCSCSKNDVQQVDHDSETSSTDEFLLTITEAHSSREAALFQLINNHRVSLNMNPFVFDSISLYFAKEHSTYMASKGTTSHAKFETRAEQIARLSGAESIVENVAKDYDTINLAFEAWLESNGHKKNIEGNYTHSAIGIAENEAGDLYFTQLFFR